MLCRFADVHADGFITWEAFFPLFNQEVEVQAHKAVRDSTRMHRQLTRLGHVSSSNVNESEWCSAMECRRSVVVQCNCNGTATSRAAT